MPFSPSSLDSGSAMAAPQSLISPTAPGTVRLTMTPQGMRAYLVKVRGILGPALSQTLMAAQAQYLKTGSWEPVDDRHEALFTHIFDRIIPALEGHDGLIVRMSQKCGTNGPKALDWLTKQLDPQTEASAVLKLIKIFQAKLSEGDLISDIQQLISLNDTLAGDEFHLNAKIVTSLLLAKLPPAHIHARASIVQRQDLVSPDELIDILTSTLGFDKAADASSSSTAFQVTPTSFAAVSSNPYSKSDKRCLNCDSDKHPSSKCTQPTVACDACGLFAGHLAKYCLVKNDSPLPTSWDEARKATMLSKRAAYKKMQEENANQRQANMCIPVQEEFSENFWDALYEANK